MQHSKHDIFLSVLLSDILAEFAQNLLNYLAQNAIINVIIK